MVRAERSSAAPHAVDGNAERVLSISREERRRAKPVCAHAILPTISGLEIRPNLK